MYVRGCGVAYGRFIFKVIIALLLGVGGTLVYVQQSSHFIAIVQSKLEEQFARDFNCKLRATVKSINFMSLKLVLKDVTTTPLDSAEGWSWKADELSLSLSWLSYLANGQFSMTATFKNYKALSDFENGYLKILSFVQKFVSGIPLAVPIALQAVVFKSATMTVRDRANGLSSGVVWSGQVVKMGPFYKIRFSITEGSATLKDIPLFSGLNGSMVMQLKGSGKSLEYSLQDDFKFFVPQLPQAQRECTFTASWQNGQGVILLYNEDRSFHLDTFRVFRYNGQMLCQGSLQAPFSYLYTMFKKPASSDEVAGQCSVVFSGNPFTNLSGNMIITNLALYGYGIDTLEFSFLTEGKTARGSASFEKNGGRFAGAWHADLENKTVKADMVNHTQWVIPGGRSWVLEDHQGHVSLSFSNTQKLLCEYVLAAYHAKTDTTVQSKGSCTIAPTGKVYALGTIDKNNYALTLEIFPHFIPLFVSYKDSEGKNLLQLIAKKTDTCQIATTLSYTFIRSLIEEYLDYTLPGEGTFHLDGAVSSTGFEGELYTKESTIRIPEMYNFLSAFKCGVSIQFFPLSFIVTKLEAQLHKGEVYCNKASLLFNDAQQLAFMHVPLNFAKCFLNWKKNFFGLTSGSFLLQKRGLAEPYSLDAFIAIDKGQLNENPLSKQGQQGVTQFMLPSEFFGNEEVKVNVAIMTQEPFHIKTPQLQSSATINVSLSNTLQSLSLEGKLKLQGGALNFPYKPLHIMRAEVRFTSQQPSDDPLIELVAQGMLKKYMVTLTVGGSIQDPQITVNAVPSLSEQQIISLLFTGSVEESLNVAMPAFVMQNIEGFLFDAAQKGQSSYSAWLEPLKRVRIFPGFFDQSGRGGFRGKIEIDVNDHLHAKLQKNFSLSEDTRIEVEYLATDDISIRGIRDERSDLGAEIEMRFKAGYPF